MHRFPNQFVHLWTVSFVCLSQLIGAGLAAASGDPAESVIRAQVERVEAELAVDPEDRELRYDLATALNELSMVTGDGNYLERSLEIFQTLHAEDPDDAVALAMLGSTQTMKAQFAGLFSKMSWLRKGLRSIDNAYEMDGDNRDVRLIRAANAAHLPAWLDRDAVAESDFTWLLADLEGVDACCSTHAGAVYYFIGYFHMARGRTSVARGYFERALELPQTPILAVKLEVAMHAAENTPSSSRG